MKKVQHLTKVLIFRDVHSNMISKIYNFRAFRHDMKRKIFVIVHCDYEIEIRDFDDYRFIGEYFEKTI